MIRARLLLIVVLAAPLVSPAPAYAHAGWWDWLDALSGPGPFSERDPALVEKLGRINSLDLKIGCYFSKSHRWNAAEWNEAQRDVKDEGKKDRWLLLFADRECFTEGSESDRFIEVSYGALSTERKALFSDRPTELSGRVTARKIGVLHFWQVHPALAVGSGVGLLVFHGETVSGHPTTLTVPLALAVRPLKLLFPSQKWASVLTVRGEALATTRGFESSDFNGASTSSFRAGPELLMSGATVSLDLIPAYSGVRQLVAKIVD